jgi:Flp pilus assembly pilin Flp
MSHAMKSFLRNDRGSATVEFVLLAMPLFIPLFLFINNYAIKSDLESSMRVMGREMARAFVQAENDESAYFVAQEVFLQSGRIFGYEDEIAKGELAFQIYCGNNPCISPDNEIRVTLTSKNLDQRITTLEFVSPWS